MHAASDGPSLPPPDKCAQGVGRRGPACALSIHAAVSFHPLAMRFASPLIPLGTVVMLAIAILAFAPAGAAPPQHPGQNGPLTANELGMAKVAWR
jgi:hypothetical protein